MAIGYDNKPNLSSERFEQLTGDTLNLSGCTNIIGTYGKINSDAGYRVCDYTIFTARGTTTVSSIQIGRNANSSGNESIALGYYAQAVGDKSIAIGCGNITCAASSSVIGGKNNTICSGNTYTSFLGFDTCTIPANTYANSQANQLVIVPSLAIRNTPAGTGDVLSWDSTSKKVCLAPTYWSKDGTCLYPKSGESILLDNNSSVCWIGSTSHITGYPIRMVDLPDKSDETCVVYIDNNGKLSKGVTGGNDVSGEKISKIITQPNSFAVKDVVGFSGTTYNKPIATTDYNGEILGIVLSADTNAFEIVEVGYVTGLTGLVANTTYFLSDTTAGLLTETEPSTFGALSKTMFFADTTTSGWVLPYAAYLIGGSGGGGSASGENVTKEITQTSHGFVVNDFIGWSGGTYNKAIGDGTYNGEFIGLITEVINDDTFKVTQSGYVSGLTSVFVPNTTYWLSTTSYGDITSIEPTTVGRIAKSVFIANTDSSGWVLPYVGYIITSGGTGGGEGGIIMSGNTVNGLTTYVDSNTICAQPNITFNGSTLEFAQGASRTISVGQNTTGVGNDLYFCAGTAADEGTATAYVGGTAYVVGGTGSSELDVAGVGGTVMICGGAGGSSTNGNEGGIGGNTYICAGSGGLGTGTTNSSGDVCIDGDTVCIFTDGSARVCVRSFATYSPVFYGSTCVKGTIVCSSNESIAGTCSVVGTNIEMSTGNGVVRCIGFNQTSFTTGATLSIIGNKGASTSAGGDVNILGGEGGSTSGVGGDVYIKGGIASSTDNGGTVFVCGGNSYGGGDVCLIAGTGSVNGSVSLTAGGSVGLMINSAAVCLNYAGSERLRTVSNGICLPNSSSTGCGSGYDWVSTSDCRLKTDITPITSALSKVDALCGVCYHFCDDKTKENRIGLIAQDVEKILPEVVAYGEAGEDDEKYGITGDKLALKYDKLTAVLIEAIKEQQIEIKKIKEEIHRLKNN